MTALTDQNEINQALIAIGDIKYEGLNEQDLVRAVLKVMKGKRDEMAMKLLESEANTDQIKFAKLVWNSAHEETRSCFLTKDNTWFMTLAGNADMTPILLAALKKHEGGSTGGGDAQKYLEIVERVKQLKIKQTASADPFSPQLTNKEKSTIKKFDEKEQERESGGDESREKHCPNESAVTYCYLIGRFILYSGVNLNKSVDHLANVVDDMLRFYSVHGQKTVLFFNQVLGGLTEIVGPKSEVNLKPFFTSLTDHDNYVTASGKGESNKFLPNHKLSLKRIIRLVYICTDYKTAWGIMNAQEEFVTSIQKLYNLEVSIDAPDMNSLAMIWYLCIGRENINAVMVDHWEKSASNELARILGNTEQDGLEAPDYVFPLNKHKTERFALTM